MKLYLFTALAGIILLCSCNPMRRMEIRNQSSSATTIIWNLKKDSALHSPFFISNATEVKFTLSPNQPSNKLVMTFGMGNWTENNLMALVDDVASMEVITANQRLVYDNPAALHSYLWNWRKGIGYRKLLLLLK